MFSLWDDINNNKKISLIQDPLLEIEIEKSEFYNLYSKTIKIIEDCCQMDIFKYRNGLDYYFQINPLRNFSLIFKNDEVRNEFYNLDPSIEREMYINGKI